MSALFRILFVLLVAVRLPSLAQPAGADQSLYAYVGQRILVGEVPYRDAWDQKPPAIHYTYALFQAVWPHESFVPAADLIVAAATALSLVALGRSLTGRPGAGELAAILFLLLGNPVFTRLAGARVRSQCEVFIALLITGAVLLAWRAGGRQVVVTPDEPLRAKTGLLALAGVLVGLAFLYKYNAGIYLPVVAVIALARASSRDLLALMIGFVLPVGATAIWFVARGALDDLLQATIAYNVQYSGETYDGLAHMFRYLVSFPLQHARVDALWFVGGLGCLTLLLLTRSFSFSSTLIPILWVGASCLSIAINGSRGLPQYFLQAYPALALAGGVATALAWPKLRPVGRIVIPILVLIAIWRIADVPKAVENVRFDWNYLVGHGGSREQYLARFGEPASDDKFSALAVHELAQFLSASTEPNAPVLVFGFSPGALVQAERRSASRFFWSRPIIVGFNEDVPGYGADGLLDELRARPPAVVVLQRRDWDPDTVDSATFFLGHQALRGWLDAGYAPAGELGNFLLWRPTPSAELKPGATSLRPHELERGDGWQAELASLD
jgi:hypothetical protein